MDGCPELVDLRWWNAELVGAELCSEESFEELCKCEECFLELEPLPLLPPPPPLPFPPPPLLFPPLLFLCVMETLPPMTGGELVSAQRSSWGGSGQRLRGFSGPSSRRKVGAWSNCTRTVSASTPPSNRSVPAAFCTCKQPSQGTGNCVCGTVSMRYRLVG